jgi:hypothetical protein
MMHTKHNMTLKEWAEKKRDIVEILAERATLPEPTPITYTELCRRMKSPPSYDPPQDSFELRDLLDEIDKDEARLGRGMLTSLVHNELLNRPGKGFFPLAKELGHRFENTEVGKLTLTIEQIQRVSREQRALRE